MAELDRRARGREPLGAAREDMDDVVDPAADDEAAAIGLPGDARIGIGHRQGLDQPAAARADPINEQILPRLRRDDLAVRTVIAVEAAGQHDHLAPVGAHRDRGGAIGDIGRVGTDAGDQRREGRAGRGERRDRLAGREMLGGRLGAGGTPCAEAGEDGECPEGHFQLRSPICCPPWLNQGNAFPRTTRPRSGSRQSGDGPVIRFLPGSGFVRGGARHDATSKERARLESRARSRGCGNVRCRDSGQLVDCCFAVFFNSPLPIAETSTSPEPVKLAAGSVAVCLPTVTMTSRTLPCAVERTVADGADDAALRVGNGHARRDIECPGAVPHCAAGMPRVGRERPRRCLGPRSRRTRRHYRPRRHNPWRSTRPIRQPSDPVPPGRDRYRRCSGPRCRPHRCRPAVHLRCRSRSPRRRRCPTTSGRRRWSRRRASTSPMRTPTRSRCPCAH